MSLIFMRCQEVNGDEIFAFRLIIVFPYVFEKCNLKCARLSPVFVLKMLVTRLVSGNLIVNVNANSVDMIQVSGE